MKTEKNILVAFISNFVFSIFSIVGAVVNFIAAWLTKEGNSFKADCSHHHH